MTLQDQLVAKIAAKRAIPPANDGEGNVLVLDGEGLDKLANALETLAGSPDDLDADTETALQSIVDGASKSREKAA